jgi:hypothetical protein
MTEAQGMSQSQDQVSSPGVSSQGTQEISSQVSQSPPSDERLFRQSEVNDIVKKVKYGAVEDYKRMQSEQPSYAQQKSNESVDAYRSQHQPQQSQPPSEQYLRQLAAEEAQRVRDQWLQEDQNRADAQYAHKIVQNFWDKMAAGKDKYQDFDKVMQNVDIKEFPNVVQILAEHVENSHDLMHHLGNNFIKMNELENLAHRSPKSAILEAQRLSQSIKDNAAASKMRLPNEPLNQMRPSNTGTDNGAMGVSDYRRKWKV